MASDYRPPTLSPTRTGGGWRLPAVAVGLALVVLAGLTRLSGADVPAPEPSPSAPAAVASATRAPTDTLPSPGATGLPVAMGLSPDGLTYADGIPTAIDGKSVHRVRDALAYPAGRTLLVGGWYIDRRAEAQTCVARRSRACASPTISDVPLAGSRDVLTAFVALDSRLAGSGAYVVSAVVEADPRCSIHSAGACQPRLRVLGTVWSELG